MFRIWLFSCDVDIDKRCFGFELLTVQIGIKFYSFFAIYKILNDWSIEFFGVNISLSRRDK